MFYIAWSLSFCSRLPEPLQPTAEAPTDDGRAPRLARCLGGAVRAELRRGDDVQVQGLQLRERDADVSTPRTDAVRKQRRRPLARLRLL